MSSEATPKTSTPDPTPSEAKEQQGPYEKILGVDGIYFIALPGSDPEDYLWCSEDVTGKDAGEQRVKKGKTRHNGDCTIYASLVNDLPTDGICTCGYAADAQYRGEFSIETMYSAERIATFREAMSDDEFAEAMKGFQAIASPAVAESGAEDTAEGGSDE